MTASCAVGVVVSPREMTSQPMDARPASAAWTNIGPDVRASRPSTMIGRPRFPSFAQTPNAAAQRAIISGVRSVPTTPRTPDTLIIRVSGMAAT